MCYGWILVDENTDIWIGKEIRSERREGGGEGGEGGREGRVISPDFPLIFFRGST